MLTTPPFNMRFLPRPARNPLLSSGLLIPIASTNLKPFPALLEPPLPFALANLQYPYFRLYFQGPPLCLNPPRQVLVLGLTEHLGPPTCYAFSFLSSMTAAVSHRNALARSLSLICLLVDLLLFLTSTHYNS